GREVDRDTLSEGLLQFYDHVIELTEVLDTYNGDLGNVLRRYKQLFELFKGI
ncbi:unnamed protein product, partial [Effrenium voratum]